MAFFYRQMTPHMERLEITTTAPVDRADGCTRNAVVTNLGCRLDAAGRYLTDMERAVYGWDV